MPNSLSNDRLDYIVSAITESFDVEILRLIIETEQTNVVEMFLNFFYKKDLCSFFILQNVANFADEICSNVLLRTFILNLTDRVSLLLSPTENLLDTEFINTFIEAITRNRSISTNEFSLLNKEINETLYIHPDPLRNIIKNNFWLLVVYIVIMFFYQTQTFKNLLISK